MTHLAALVLGIAGCLGTAPAVWRSDPLPEDAPVVVWTSRAEPLAYRMRTVIRQRWGSEETGRHLRGIVYVERDAQGRLTLAAAEETALVRVLPVDDVDSVHLLFPLPRHRPWRPVSTIGRAAELPVDEQVTVGRRHGRLVDVAVERCTRFDAGAAGEPEEVRACERMHGTFDVAAERPEHWSIEFEVLPARADVEGSVAGTIDLDYDAAASAARADLLAALRAEEAAGARELADEAAEHGAAEELRQIAARLEAIDDLDEAEVDALELFHARASNGALWRLLLATRSPAGRDHLLEVLVLIPYWHGDVIPDESIALLRERLPGDRTLQILAASLADARLAPELRRMLRSGDEDVRGSAAAALSRIAESAPSLAEVRGAAAGEEPIEALGRARAYLEGASDPRALLPVLVDLLREHAGDEFFCEETAALLARLTGRILGPDPAAWARFRAEHGSETREVWLASAGADPDPETRTRVFEELGHLPPSALARPAMLASLEHRDEHVRLAAAEALARWRDPRAAPALVSLLSARQQVLRARAFAALGFVAPATLGYDPGGPPLERARAIGRWRAWLASPGSAQRPLPR